MSNKYFAGLFLFLSFGIVSMKSFAGAKDKHMAKQAFSIIGNVSNMPPQTVILELLRANDSVMVVDSQHADAGGHFAFKGAIAEPGLYRLHFTTDKFVLLSVDKGDIRLTGSWPLTEYDLQGSAPSTELRLFVDTVIGYITLMNKCNTRIDSLKGIGKTELVPAEEKNRMEVSIKFRDVVKHYSANTPYQPNAVIAARILNPQDDIVFYGSFDKSMDTRFPGTVMTKEFHQFMDNLRGSMPEPNEIGDKAPDLALEDTNGKAIKLSSLQGKYVLLDFWASWCGPCRAENPNVLAAYNKFKDKNFTILAVSLDNNKEPWLKAVHHDALLWPQVSDLKGWKSPAAAKYGVHSIPSNFLIDPKGTIIAKGLRGPELESKLAEVLK